MILKLACFKLVHITDYLYVIVTLTHLDFETILLLFKVLTEERITCSEVHSIQRSAL